MSSNPALYRYIDFVGGNILDASNVSLLQTELEKLGLQGLGQLYVQGTLLNAIFNISGSSIILTAFNPLYDIFGFINGQFEDLGATISLGGVQPVSGSSNPLYLNWSWDIKTSSDDTTFVDGITGEPTIEAGQLSFNVSWTDTSATPLNTSTQFGKNTSPVILAYFNMSGSPITVTYINGVAPYAWGTPLQGGFLRLTNDSVWLPNSSVFTLGQQIVDSNGNIQQITTAGITGSSVPTWNATPAGTTTDNTVTWTNEGSVIRGVALSPTDPAVTNARNPLPNSVYNSSVTSLISSGLNSSSLPAWLPGNAYAVAFQIVDSNGNIQTVVSLAGTGTSGGSAPVWNTSLGGQTVDNPGTNQLVWINGGSASTTKYDPATPNQGGIFTDNIIYTTLKEKLTTFLDSVNTAVENTLIALTNHIGKALGSPATHPFPTALQVGAAPASHVGQVLGLGTSHPAQVNSDHAGFVVLRNPANPPNPTDYAYSLTDGTNVLAGILHTGDAYTQLSNVANAQGGNGSGGTATYTGNLGLMSLIANVLAEHVNYKTHGNNNPHNLDAADISAVDAAFVDAQVSQVIGDATAYTDAKTNVAVRVVTTTGRNIGLPVYAHHPSNTLPVYTLESITWVIINLGGYFEFALGQGNYWTGGQVALPEASGWSSSQIQGNVAYTFGFISADPEIGGYSDAYYNPATRVVSVMNMDDGGQNLINNYGWCTFFGYAWRSVAPPATIISAYDNTVGTFGAGHVGDVVTITGRNFGSTQGTSSVYFNGTVVVTYSSWSSNTLVVVVPVGATTGLIEVVVSGNPGVFSPFVFTIS